MDISEIRKLLRQGHSVVLVESGQTPLVVTELKTGAPSEEPVPIASRWPKSPPPGLSYAQASESKPDQVLERLNKEILALKAQIAQEEEGIN